MLADDTRDEVADLAAEISDPYGSALVAAVAARPALDRRAKLALVGLARRLESLGRSAFARRCGDLDHGAIAGAISDVADHLLPRPRPTCAEGVNVP